MKVETDLRAGGYAMQAQDQAERFFQKTDSFLQEASQKIGQAASATAQKAGQVWNCAFQS